MEKDQDQKLQTIPLVEEKLSVKPRKITTGTKRVRKVVVEREETINEPLKVTSYDIARVAHDRVVDEIEPTRQEGDTTIIPVYEEVLVTEKRLLLKEEIHITCKESLRSHPQRITLRKEEVHIEEIEEDATSSAEAREGPSRETDHHRGTP